MNLGNSQGGLKLEINIPQHISAKSKGGLIIEGGVISSEYSNNNDILVLPTKHNGPIIIQNAIGQNYMQTCQLSRIFRDLMNLMYVSLSHEYMHALNI